MFLMANWCTSEMALHWMVYGTGLKLLLPVYKPMDDNNPVPSGNLT